ncbi:MAG: baseplate J/gp47 family protein [Paracoccaceae bacterium]
MSRFTAINLSGLAPPEVIETLDFEAIVTEMRNDVVARFPAIRGVIDLESEPARKLIEAFAYREMLLRARINDASRAVMLASATGNDLDHLAVLFSVARIKIEDERGDLIDEPDSRLRRRVQLAPDAFSVAGPKGAYVYHALTMAAWARDASAVMTRPGRVRVTMLHAGAEPRPTLDEREAVRLALVDNDLRPLTDMVEVLSPNIYPTRIEAKLTLYPGPDQNTVKTAAEKALTDWLEANRMLGMNLRRSAIYAKLHAEGVHSVELIEPAEDLVLSATDVYRIDGVDISLAYSRDE